jgi:DNA-binding winged helix-turn-helix (wHTH) protein/TolB-like protein
MEQQPIRAYQIAEFTLDLDRHRLTRGDRVPVPLSGRAFEVLAYLVANRDRIVTKRELMDAVWPRIIVEENNLTQAISFLRRTLGDSREVPRFILTMAGRGYRFVGDAIPVTERVADSTAPLPSPVTPSSTNDAAVAAAVTTTPAPVALHAGESRAPALRSRRTLLLGAGAAAVAAAAAGVWWFNLRRPARVPASIAVLPFKPLLSTSRNEAVEIGVTELLINRLSILPGVVVRPLSSVRRYASPEQDPLQAGHALGVAAVVDGYVQVHEDSVRLTARLLDVATGESLWAGNYTERMADFFAVQDALATQLLSALAVPVPQQARRQLLAHSTADAEAWRLYANGRYQLERRDPAGLSRAREYFQAAERRDPKFALAITGLSEAWALAGAFGILPPAEAFGEARRAAQRALAIDPQLAPALVALGHVKTQLDLDFRGGRALYERALTLAPNAAWTYAFLALNTTQSGSVTDALDDIARAQALEPAAIPFMALGGLIRYFARQFEASRRQLSGILESAPGAVLAEQFLARVLLVLGRAPDVIRMLKGHNVPTPGSPSTLGRAYALVGNEAAARAEIARLEDQGASGFGVAFDVALIHLALGDRQLALAALERAVGDHSQMIGYVNVEPALDPIRAEPRFRAVVARVGLA